jgi:ComF family protein
MADTRVALRYEFPADWLVTELKFSARLWHAPLLAVLIAEALEERPIPDLTDAVLVPVPLHRRRQTVRGYNQAVEIARPLSRRIDCRLDTGLLVRERATREQSSLSARERRRNVAGAFRLRRSPDFEHGIVVDDVVTTGATSREVARLLRDAGCRRVSVLAAARA